MPERDRLIFGRSGISDSLRRSLREFFQAGADGFHDFANIQVEVIAQPAVAEKLMQRLEKEFFAKFAMVAYETDIRVLRREKF